MTRIRGKYAVLGKLGSGGMAEVFRAKLEGAEGFSRPVAIKKMLRAPSSDPEFAEMFISEARIASLLTHPNIVSVLDFDRDESGQLFLVMELVEGRDLRRVRDLGRLPVSISAFIAGEVLSALVFAHNLEHQGRPMAVIHRDISPHNVLISWDGAVKLGDFGVAKAALTTNATSSGMVKGKAAYLSPEQARCDDLDPRSDLFAVGIVLHELLTGARLFGVRGAPDGAVIHRVLHLPVESPRKLNPQVSEPLAEVCLRLLERDREQRFPSAREAFDALTSCEELTPRGRMELARLMSDRFPEDDHPRSPTVSTKLETELPTKPVTEDRLVAPPIPTSSKVGPSGLPFGGFSIVDSLVDSAPPALPVRASPRVQLAETRVAKVAAAPPPPLLSPVWSLRITVLALVLAAALLIAASLHAARNAEPMPSPSPSQDVQPIAEAVTVTATIPMLAPVSLEPAEREPEPPAPPPRKVSKPKKIVEARTLRDTIMEPDLR